MTAGWDYRTFEQALSTVIASSVAVGRSEKIPLDEAEGRVLAADVAAVADVPPWNRSAVDGYAVRSEDTSEGGETVLKIVGEVRAGTFFRGRIGKGECVRISTGAPLPDGANAAVMHERTAEDGDRVTIPFAVSKGEEVSLRGVDIRKGRRVAAGGTVITPGVIGAIASQGRGSVTVRKKPVIAVIPGGDEIAPVGSRAGRSQVYDVNSHTIAAVVSKSGGRAVIMKRVPDFREDVKKALRSALKYDAAVFSSGSSAGQRDFVAGLIREEGKLLFHGIRVRPGRPTMFGIVSGKPVFGLAGHPVSAFLGALYLLGPCVRKMAGLPQREPRSAELAYEGEEEGRRGMMQLLPVSVTGGRCRGVFKESGAITSISMADGIVRIPSDHVLKHGDVVRVELFD